MIAEVLALGLQPKMVTGTLGTPAGKIWNLKNQELGFYGHCKNRKSINGEEYSQVQLEIPDDGLVIQLKSSSGQSISKYLKRNWEILIFTLPDSDATEQISWQEF